MGRVRQQPLETEGFARSQAALPPPAALQIRTQFVFGIGIRLIILIADCVDTVKDRVPVLSRANDMTEISNT